LLKSTNINEKFITVNLGDRSYPIYIGAGNLMTLAEKLNNFKLKERPVVISNPEVLELYKNKIDEAFENAGSKVDYVEVPSGEGSKTVEKALALIDKFFDFNVDRQTPVIAVGGGVIGDLAGYVSATFMRGMPYIQVPTTLLAQLDSSVGGKVAVNYHEAKNIIGFFYQPKFVLADVSTLSSLSKRDYACGIAETIKYSLIADNNFLKYMEENIQKLNDRDEEVLIEIVTRCCRIKAKIVEEDERDMNLRGVLNLGHTIGHAIEGKSHFVEYRHGEAVSIGLVASAYISLELGYIDDELVNRIKTLIEKAGLPTKVKDVKIDEIINGFKLDKKVVAGQARFVLLKRPGETVIEPVSPEIVKKAVERVIDG
jgi:3-dehydroquinate synthase